MHSFVQLREKEIAEMVLYEKAAILHQHMLIG